MEKKNIEWVSNLRVVSLFAVIVIHVSSGYAGDYALATTHPSWWIIATIIDSFARFSVPAFVMISGLLWLSGSETVAGFYKKKTLRLVGPFLFWSFVFYLFNRYYLNNPSSEVPLWKDFYTKFQYNLISYHFWYVYMLIGLFLITPIFQVWIKNVGKTDIKTFLVLWFTVLLYQNTFFDDVRIGIQLEMVYGYIGYLVLGYFLVNHVQLSPRTEAILGKSAFFLGVLITFLGTYYFSSRDKVIYGKFYDYLTLNVAMSSIGIYLWFKNTVISNKFFIKIVHSIGKYGYGIYLCHVMVLFVVAGNFEWNSIHPLIIIPSFALATMLLSWGIVYLLNRIPYAKYIIG